MDLLSTSLIISCTVIAPFAIAVQLGFNEWLALLPIMLTSALCYFAGLHLIPVVKELTLKAGLCGRDLNKTTSKPVPESLGLVPATLYLIAIVFSQLMYAKSAVDQHQLNAAAFSICFMTLLGFTDDVMDLKWRYKLVLPFVAATPIIVAYNGLTMIVIPQPFRLWLGLALELGFIYKIYMSMLSVFCTNSINIYAGLNGLEVGQSIVIGCAALAHNFIEVTLHTTDTIYEQHYLSLILLIPFVWISLALFKYNQYPSEVFIGDTYCYFAGMTLSVAGILGHYSKTLLLFFLPQILNFLISFPQLTGFVKCPRHRLPKFNPETKLLEGVKEHWTLINVVLHLLGPKSEAELVKLLLVFQIVCAVLAMFIRYYVAKIFY